MVGLPSYEPILKVVRREFMTRAKALDAESKRTCAISQSLKECEEKENIRRQLKEKVDFLRAGYW